MPNYSNGRVGNLHSALEILKTIAGYAIIAYAYLYLLGYLYLFSYFSSWGLNIHELGFPVLDYATIAIIPNLSLFAAAILTCLISFLLSLLVFNYLKGKLNQNNFILWAAPLLVMFITLLWIALKSTLLAITVLLYYPLGAVIGYLKIIKKARIRALTTVAIAVLLIIMLVNSATSGTHYAGTFKKYSNRLFGLPEELNEVIIFTNEPLAGLDIYQTAPNKYEGLFVLTYRQDAFYLVPDPRQTEFIFRAYQLGQEAARIFAEVFESDGKGSGEIEASLRRLNDEADKIWPLIQRALGLRPESFERVRLIRDARSSMSALGAVASRVAALLASSEISSATRKNKLDRAQELLVRQRDILESHDMITRGTYALKKEKISHMIYVYRKHIVRTVGFRIHVK